MAACCCLAHTSTYNQTNTYTKHNNNLLYNGINNNYSYNYSSSGHRS